MQKLTAENNRIPHTWEDLVSNIGLGLPYAAAGTQKWQVSMSFAKLAQIFFFYADNDMIYQARCTECTGGEWWRYLKGRSSADLILEKPWVPLLK